jgi:large subunit ribosomal protein L30
VLEIKQIRSAIGRKRDHKDTLRALGITRMGQTVYHDDNPVIRGMVRKISYMLEVAEVEQKGKV